MTISYEESQKNRKLSYFYPEEVEDTNRQKDMEEKKKCSI